MTWEAVAFGCLVALALVVSVAPALRGASVEVRKTAWTMIFPACTGLVAFAVLYHPPATGERAVKERPIEIPRSGYVGSATCQACHPGHYASWHASYHRTMTQVARSESVKGDFDDVTLQLDGFKFRLYRRSEDYLVDMQPPAGGTHPGFEGRKVVLVTGSHHYQVYWLATSKGREVEQLPFAFVLADRLWMPRRSVFLRPWEPFTGELTGGWNTGCIRCHTIDGRPGKSRGQPTDSMVTELGIACEGCHGPAAQHASRYRAPDRRYAARLRDEDAKDQGEAADHGIVHPAHLSARRSAEACGQCHSVFGPTSMVAEMNWLGSGNPYKPGTELAANRFVVWYSKLLELGPEERAKAWPPLSQQYFDERFWSDGMVRVTGREYLGLLDTPCFQRGELTCLSCHSMHQANDDRRRPREWADDQLKPGMEGREACLQCHRTYADTGRMEAHTHHPAASRGSDCYNCHMPYTSFGLLKAVRSHTIDSPDVRDSLRAGRPNACNQCHLDRTLAWTAETLQRWYGTPIPPLDAEEREVAASLSWLLKGDAGQRALMAWSLGWGPAREASGSEWMAPFLAQLLDDPYDAVRFIAYRSLRGLPGYADFPYDYLGDAASRSAAVRRAAERWTAAARGSAPGVERAHALLLDEAGAVDQTTVRGMVARRDDRRVFLQE